MKKVAVMVGRFAPFHLGHEATIKKMIEENGQENCLILIGSSDSKNSRTPFSYTERLSMIQDIFPEIEVLPLPDVRPELEHFDGTTNSAWLDSISRIEAEKQANFVFYGGSREDLAILAERFETRIVVDRSLTPTLSATSIRRLLETSDRQSLTDYLNPQIVAKIESFYDK